MPADQGRPRPGAAAGARADSRRADSRPAEPGPGPGPAGPAADSPRQAGPGPADRAQLAADALAQARADARARGDGVVGRGARPGRPGAGPARGRAGAAGQASPPAPQPAQAAVPPASPDAESGVSRQSGATGAADVTNAAAPAPAARPAARRSGRPRRGRRDDPEPLRAAIGGLLEARGWRDDLAVGGLFGRWDQIVGAELAAHTRPEAFTDGELLVTADSTAWATQVRLLAATLVARVNAELGGPVVRRVKVRGPAPPPPSGPWRVRGGRGPRGDYG